MSLAGRPLRQLQVVVSTSVTDPLTLLSARERRVIPGLDGHDPNDPDAATLHAIELRAATLIREWFRSPRLIEDLQRAGVDFLPALEFHVVSELIQAAILGALPAWPPGQQTASDGSARGSG